MTKYYIAFSIHGTNKFTVATKDIDLSISPLSLLAQHGFTVAQSRRFKTDPADGIKMHWSKLNRKDGTPLQDKGWVTRRFKQLVAQGWVLVKDKGER